MPERSPLLSGLLVLSLGALAGCSTIRWQDVAAAALAQNCQNASACRLSCPPPGTPAGDVPPVCQSTITGISYDPHAPTWRR